MTEQARNSDSYAQARKAMVDSQIRARGVRDSRVLEVMMRIPRHEFVDASLHGEAYNDHPLPIPGGQTISQPYIVAYMTELLELDGTEKVLEIGTGCGYQTAALAELAETVYTIEIVPVLCKLAKSNLERLKYKNVRTRCGDGYRGWKKAAPFDAIIVTAAPDHIPEPLIRQLAPGGILVLPVGSHFQELTVVRKTARGLEKDRVLPVRFVPMTGEAEKK